MRKAVRTILIAALCLSGKLWGQALDYTPRAAAAFVNPGSGWVPWVSAASFGQIDYQPYAVGLYCQSTANGPWAPCQPGGGGATIPSTTNLISGNGSGNGADSGIVPSNVGTLSGAQTVSGLKTFSGGIVTDKTSIASSVSTSSTPTLLVTDSEAATAVMNVSKILAPNMANGNTIYWEFGNLESTDNSFFLLYQRAGAGSVNNRFSIQPYSVPIALSIFAGSQDVNIGSNTTDTGYKLDVQGSTRATQFVGSGTTPTIAAGTGAGTSPTGVSVTGTPSSFTVNLTTGTGPASSAVIATVTYGTAYGSAPRTVCQANNAATAAANTTLFVTETTTTTVLNAGATALSDSTAYSWDCHTIQ